MRALAFILWLMLLATNAYAGGVIVKTVEAQGVGQTREEAVNSAITEAIARATGMSLSAQNQVRRANLQALQSTDGVETFSSQSEEHLKSEVKTAVRGTVRGYQIIRVAPDADSGLVRATLSVDVNCFELGRETERMRIAVLPFLRHHTIQTNEELERMLFQINQSIVRYLTGTRHFAVLDRIFEQQRMDELATLMRPDVRAEERARLGNTLATDYIVMGVVTGFNYVDGFEADPYLNEKIRVMRGDVTIDWRVIEAATGQVVLADTVSKTMRNSAAFSQASRSMGEDIGAHVTSQIYPLAAIAFENGQFLLAQGATSLRVGDVYELVRQGSIRVDPYTKEKIGRDELPVGRVRISRVSPKMGYATILECKEDPTGMAPREYLLRPTEDGRSGHSAGNKTKKSASPSW